MSVVRILPKDLKLEEYIEGFRNDLIKNYTQNSLEIIIFLVCEEKFEKVWNTLYYDKQDVEELNLLKEEWIDLIRNKRVVVTDIIDYISCLGAFDFLKTLKKNIDNKDIF